MLKMKDLELGKVYRFVHSRKGEFDARLLNVMPSEDDPADAVMLLVEIKTGLGSGNEHLVNALTRDEQGRKVPEELTRKLLRPSLIKGVQTGHQESKSDA